MGFDMLAYKSYATVESSGELTVQNIPFKAGEPVEIVIMSMRRSSSEKVAEWISLMRDVQELKCSGNISDEDINNEINAHRSAV